MRRHLRSKKQKERESLTKAVEEEAMLKKEEALLKNEVSMLSSTKEKKVARVKKRARAELSNQISAGDKENVGNEFEEDAGAGTELPLTELDEAINLITPILQNTLEVTNLFNIESSGDGDGDIGENSGDSTDEGSGSDFEGSGDIFVAERELDSLEEDLVVDTDAGRVYGSYRASSSGAKVVEYLGVPYADVPTGPRRFLAPLPPRPWGGVRKALTPAPRCWDATSENSWEATATKEMAEDCLYLSLWTPGGKGKAVLVWMTGSGEEDEGGSELAARGDVIVVRVESRRGALGFLALGDEIPGNAGLLDQVMALQWVKDNIDRFGGLSDRVTIMGVRDAADLASLHLLSPLSCPLFQAAILMSGATPPPLPSTEDKASEAIALGQLLACSGDKQELTTCLRATNPQVLTNQERAAAPMGFLPNVDGAFMVEQPGDLMEGKFFKRAPLLVGSNTAEGQEVLVQLLPDMEEREVLYLTLAELDASLARIFPENSEPLQSLIKFQYGMYGEGEGNRTEMAVRRFWGLESVLADLRTVCPVARIASSIGAEGTRVYR